MSKKIIKYLKPILIAIFSIWFISGCVDDSFNLSELSTHVENQGEWGFPIANTSFVMEDLIKMIDTTGFIETNDNGLILLVYSDTAYSATAADEIVFPDQSYDTTFNEQDYQNAGGFQGGLVKMEKNNVNFLFIAAATNQLLDSILFSSTLLDINITSTFKYSGNVTITIPELKKDGQPYQKEIEITDASGNFTYNNTFDDIDGYKLDFINFADPNNFFISYEVELNESSGSGSVSPQAFCDIDVGFRDINYNYVWGYVGTKIIPINETELPLDFFQNFDYGQFDLFDPRIKVKVNNSFGVEIGMHFSTFQMKLSDDTWADVVGTDVPTEADPWLFYGAESSYPNPLTARETEVEITGLHSNINDLVSQLPKKIKFSEEIKLNPRETGEKTNFMSHDSRIDLILDFEIPLWFRSSGLAFQDTLNMDLGAMVSDIEMIEYLDLTLEIANGLPHNLGLKAYLVDSLYNIVDSIPNINESSTDTLWIVESGLLGPDSVINQETEKTVSTSIIRYEKNVDIFEGVKYILLDIKFLTTEGTDPDAPYVKYFDFYEMDFNVRADWKMNYSDDL